jgi:hypothetical protein
MTALPAALEMRTPEAHMCAADRRCTERATGTAGLGHHVIVWACAKHVQTDV